MSTYTQTLSKDDGQTLRVDWTEVTAENAMAHDFFEAYRAEHGYVEGEPYDKNVEVYFPESVDTYAKLRKVVCALNRAPKTLGTYVTRLNKIASCVNPDAVIAHRRGASTSQAPVGVKRGPTEDSVELFEIDGDARAIVHADGSVTVSDWHVMSYWIDAILLPDRWMNRWDSLRQFEDGAECKAPEWTLTYAGRTVGFGAKEPSAEDVARKRAELAPMLIEAGIWDLSGLKDAQPTMTGGGERWLEDWLRAHFPDRFSTRPLPKTATE